MLSDHSDPRFELAGLCSEARGRCLADDEWRHVAHYVRKNGELVRKSELGFCYACRCGAPRHLPGDIESRERFQLGGGIAGYRPPRLQQVLDLLALRSRQRRPFSHDEPVLAGCRVLP